jgi:hypothetical protein
MAISVMPLILAARGAPGGLSAREAREGGGGGGGGRQSESSDPVAIDPQNSVVTDSVITHSKVLKVVPDAGCCRCGSSLCPHVYLPKISRIRRC